MQAVDSDNPLPLLHKETMTIFRLQVYLDHVWQLVLRGNRAGESLKDSRNNRAHVW